MAATPIKIFLAFLRLGLTAFGGPAMVAYIRNLVVEEKEWVAGDSFKKGVALCQTIPGATAMQAAAYAGLRAGGGWGAVAAYIGFGLPAFGLMVTISALYAHNHDLPAIISLFSGLQIIVIALIANATLNFGRTTINKATDLLLAAGCAALLAFGANPIVVIIAAGLSGALLFRKSVESGTEHSADSAEQIRWAAIAPSFYLALIAACLLLCLFLWQRDLYRLAILMMKIDFFAYGGGYTSVPLMFHEIVEVRHWLSQQALLDGIAMGQLTPGPIVITATFVGYLLAGIKGAVVGTVAIFTPSLFILLLIVPYFDRVQHNLVLQRFLRGILLSFVGLLLSVTIKFGLAVTWTPLAIIFFVAAFIALWQKVNILWVVLVGALVAALLF